MLITDVRIRAIQQERSSPAPCAGSDAPPSGADGAREPSRSDPTARWRFRGLTALRSIQRIQRHLPVRRQQPFRFRHAAHGRELLRGRQHLFRLFSSRIAGITGSRMCGGWARLWHTVCRVVYRSASRPNRWPILGLRSKRGKLEKATSASRLAPAAIRVRRAIRSRP